MGDDKEIINMVVIVSKDDLEEFLRLINKESAEEENIDYMYLDFQNKIIIHFDFPISKCLEVKKFTVPIDKNDPNFEYLGSLGSEIINSLATVKGINSVQIDTEYLVIIKENSVSEKEIKPVIISVLKNIQKNKK